MPDLETHPRYKVGDKVRLTSGAPLIGTVTEVRGTHSPSGRILYRIRVPMSQEPLWLDVREEEIEKA
ncbi:MAG TPA: hypothetical protein VG013_30485 [Gemmataceae bacterium]|jgi:hypothetical protein|nr:hypothetical protein [Gemmataceae bacterium]